MKARSSRMKRGEERGRVGRVPYAGIDNEFSLKRKEDSKEHGLPKHRLPTDDPLPQGIFKGMRTLGNFGKILAC